MRGSRLLIVLGLCLVLQDSDGDGIVDRQTVFHHGRDVDSAFGICVIGEGPARKVIVSCAHDVFVAPDGSLIVADRYDPGVGGHGMADTEKARLNRIAPTGSAWAVPPTDSSTVAGEGGRCVEVGRGPRDRVAEPRCRYATDAL